MITRRNHSVQQSRFASMSRVSIVIICIIVAGAFANLRGQAYLFDRVQLYDQTTNTTVMVAKPDNIATSQSIIMPTTVPTPGQLLSISSVSGSTLNLGWTTAAVGTKPPSNRLTTAQDAASPAGLSVSVGANKKYTFYAMLLVNRKSSGSDNIAFSITGPASADLEAAVRCYNCSAGTTNIATYTTSVTPLTTPTIDPSGDDYTQRAYSIQGRIVTSSTAGSLVITATNAGANTNNVIIGAQSYVLTLEIQ